MFLPSKGCRIICALFLGFLLAIVVKPAPHISRSTDSRHRHIWLIIMILHRIDLGCIREISHKCKTDIYIDIYLVKSYLRGKEAIIRILIKCAFFKRGEKRKPKLSEQACRNTLAGIANPCRPQLHSSSHVMNLPYLIVLHTKWHHSKPDDLNRAIWECSGKGRLISSTKRRFCRNTELEKYSAQTGNFDPLQKAPDTPYVLSIFIQMSLFLKPHPARIHLYIGIRLID